MKAPAERDAESTQERNEDLSSSELVFVRGNPSTTSQAANVRKHGLHGLFTDLSANRASHQACANQFGPQQLTNAKHHLDASKSHVPQEVQGKSKSLFAYRGLANINFEEELRGLVEHYAVEGCVIALQDGCSTRVLAKHGFDLGLEPCADDIGSGFEFFRHHVARDLPIIISEASKMRSLEKHPLVAGAPGICFYAAAPLITGPSAYAGTVSIWDRTPRHDFELQDCEALQKIAAKVAEIIKLLR